MGNFVQETSDASFEQDVLTSDKLVLVDFWAPWCQPCKMIMPHVDAVAEAFSDRGVAVYKLNVDDNQMVPQQYGIRGIPSLLLFKGGQVVSTQVGGSINKAQLTQVIEQHMGSE